MTNPVVKLAPAQPPLIYLLVFADNWRGWMVTGAGLILAVGTVWLYSDYIEAARGALYLLDHRHCLPVRLSPGGCSFQFGPHVVVSATRTTFVEQRVFITGWA
jgi:hypothetical protein